MKELIIASYFISDVYYQGYYSGLIIVYMKGI